ncbi:MAG: UDP-N-acetylenolpyruvoylglucosamine reductase [Geobacteraceae bacterium GWC2_58_44]|nr:MAG: UDP-N-acetylenolpyruvoylglucosamine reductase [Geobacteraceae bacterium GWC2_58_44]HBG08180.1 UDP-N-acetylenolpyruvoylglucosamine reductase [Geobacter sp.]
MIAFQEHVPLAPFTSLKIGGPARFFTTAASVTELREALLFAREKGLPFGILGGGSNLLVSDDGFRGVIIRLQMEGVRRSGCEIEAEAGVDLTGLIYRTADWGLSGMESLAGIPGLLGGAVRGNAGAYGSCIGEVAATVFALHAESLALLALEREDCGFSYRSSRFKLDPRLIVVSALLVLSKGEPEAVRHKVEGTIAKRTARHLQCEKSVGSFFMNPVVTDPELIRRFETDQQLRCRESRIPAGWLIDQSGLRNTRVGAAMVSALHANYLINTGEASADEMIRLARLVKSRVRDAMGVQLQEEVSCLGFPAPEQQEVPR